MDDSKLLELASLASGDVYSKEHNPLERDDLALRLAVNLQIDLIHFTGHLRADVRDMPDTHELYNGDPCAATRRAIVRAAAAIGQSFPATSSASSS